MEITSKSVGNCKVLNLNGRMVDGINISTLRSALQEVVKQKPRKVVLNLANVNCIDSLGIGELAYSHTFIKDNGGRLVLTNLPKRIWYQLHIVRLLTVIDNVETVEKALESA